MEFDVWLNAEGQKLLAFGSIKTHNKNITNYQNKTKYKNAIKIIVIDFPKKI